MICDIAYTQLNYILSKMSDDLKRKIPYNFIEYIEKNDKKQNSIELNRIKDMELHDDTKKILSVIYTDYIATEEEREIIRNKERIIERKKEEEKRQKYKVDVFNNQNSITENSINNSMIIQEKQKWYKKIINKIKKILKF